MNRKLSLIAASLLLAGASQAANILLSSSPLTVPSNSAGVSFTYSGTLTQNDTLGFIAMLSPCLQAGSAYCTNAAGILTTAPIGTTNTFVGTFGGTTGTWNFGQLVLIISGVGATDPFLPNVANGLGSGAPPTTLTLPTSTLASLGFGSFSVVNPTLTFIVADTNYADNTGSFQLSQPGTVPEPTTITLMGLGLVAAGFLRKRAQR